MEKFSHKGITASEASAAITPITGAIKNIGLSAFEGIIEFYKVCDRLEYAMPSNPHGTEPHLHVSYCLAFKINRIRYMEKDDIHNN
jgi:hypothetical protein